MKRKKSYVKARDGFQLVVAKSASARHEVREGAIDPLLMSGKLERQRSRSGLIAEAAAVQEHATDLWNEELEQSREILKNFLETLPKADQEITLIRLSLRRIESLATGSIYKIFSCCVQYL
ncbi:hypothetical protein SAMN05216412_11519 [Nitrosospira multiformis]|uniref:Uncharacterized protein n=1 Tax=Nitrosospira multiformis TaxID=1231 RepID=A0A1I0GNB4_9PROT|nr:hypothetical protein SAMN05216412_11519 [Nitrosospira multiformis]